MVYNKYMVQDQLVEYVSSQMKAGVSRDAIKAALAGVGWVAADVEDTLKKVEGASKPGMSTSAAPVSAMPSSTVSSMGASSPKSVIASVGGVQKSSGMQSIRMSDLVSASTTTGPVMGVAPMGVSPKSTAPKMESVVKTGTPRGGNIIMMIVGIVVILALAGVAGFLYFQNTGLAAKVAALGGQSTDVASQISGLNTQVQALSASNTALAAQVAALTAQNADLMNDLSFVAVPPGASSTASSTVSVSGTLTGGKSSYTLATARGVVVSVANAKDAKVAAALTPFVGSTSTVQLTGTHVAGSQYIIVTAVNGTVL